MTLKRVCKWIDVKDRLPGKYEAILALDCYGDVFICQGWQAHPVKGGEDGVNYWLPLAFTLIK